MDTTGPLMAVRLAWANVHDAKDIPIIALSANMVINLLNILAKTLIMKR
jgi:hypothetical protein